MDKSAAESKKKQITVTVHKKEDEVKPKEEEKKPVVKIDGKAEKTTDAANEKIKESSKVVVVKEESKAVDAKKKIDVKVAVKEESKKVAVDKVSQENDKKPSV